MESLTTTNPFEEFEHFYPSICTESYAQETYIQEEPFIVNPNEIETEMEVYTENCFMSNDVDEKDFDKNFDSMSLSELVTFPEDLKEFGIEINSKEDENLKLTGEENLSFSTLNAIEAAIAVENQSIKGPHDLFIEANIGENIDYSDHQELDKNNNQFDNTKNQFHQNNTMLNNDNEELNSKDNVDNDKEFDKNNDSSESDIVDVETSSDICFSSLQVETKPVVISSKKRFTPSEAHTKVYSDKQKSKSKQDKVSRMNFYRKRNHCIGENKFDKKKSNKIKSITPGNTVLRNNKINMKNETSNKAPPTTNGNTDKNDHTKMTKISKYTEDLDKKLQETVELILERRRKNLEWKKSMKKKAQTALEAFQVSKPSDKYPTSKNDSTFLESPDHSYAKENYLKRQKISKSTSYGKDLNFKSFQKASPKKMTSILNLSKFNSIIKSSEVLKRSNSVVTEMSQEPMASHQPQKQPPTTTTRFFKSSSSYNLSSYKSATMKTLPECVSFSGVQGSGTLNLSRKWSCGVSISNNESSNDFEKFFRSSPSSSNNGVTMDISLSPVKPTSDEIFQVSQVDYKINEGNLDEGVAENVVVSSEHAVPLLCNFNDNVQLSTVDTGSKVLFNINPVETSRTTEKLKKKISLSDYRKMSRHNSQNVERKVSSESDLACFFDHTVTEDHNYFYKPPKFEIVRKNSTQNDLKMYDSVKIGNLMETKTEFERITQVRCKKEKNFLVKNQLKTNNEAIKDLDRVKLENIAECKKEYITDASFNNDEIKFIDSKPISEVRHLSRRDLRNSQNPSRSFCPTKPQQYRSPNATHNYDRSTKKPHHKSPSTLKFFNQSPNSATKHHSRSPSSSSNSRSPSLSSRDSSTLSISSFTSRSPSRSSSGSYCISRCSSRSSSRSSLRSYSSDVSYSSASSFSVYRNRKRKSRASWNIRSHKRQASKREDSEKMAQAGQERRIVYIGCLKSTTSKYDLQNLLKCFGTIVDSSVHSKPSGAFYGFVTFEKSSQAAKCKQEGHLVPGCEHYDFGYGGRRQFCGSGYNDLDRDVAIYKHQHRMTYKGTQGMNFDELLAFHPSLRQNR